MLVNRAVKVGRSLLSWQVQLANDLSQRLAYPYTIGLFEASGVNL